MVLTQKKQINNDELIRILNRLDETVKKNTDDVKKMKTYSNLKRRQRTETVITLDELNCITGKKGIFTYGSKRI